VRTPKSGGYTRKVYQIKRNPFTYLEIIIGTWCLFGVGVYFYSHHFLIGHFMLIYAAGFISIGCLSWWHDHRALLL